MFSNYRKNLTSGLTGLKNLSLENTLNIQYYEYENFHNFKGVGVGSFGKVYRVNWKNSPEYLALKSFFNFNNATVKEIVHEVMMK